MSVNQTWFKPALTALWIVAVAGLYFNLYDKRQFVASCQAQLNQLHLIDVQTTQTETQLDDSEARLDAAEAQLDRAK